MLEYAELHCLSCYSFLRAAFYRRMQAAMKKHEVRDRIREAMDQRNQRGIRTPFDLLREVDRRARILSRFAECFVDHRRPELIEHSVSELVSQRIYGLALGYEDLNDHDELRWDPLMGLLAGKSDPSGGSRVRERDQGKALAGKSTLKV